MLFNFIDSPNLLIRGPSYDVFRKDNGIAGEQLKKIVKQYFLEHLINSLLVPKHNNFGECYLNYSGKHEIK